MAFQHLVRPRHLILAAASPAPADRINLVDLFENEVFTRSILEPEALALLGAGLPGALRARPRRT